MIEEEGRGTTEGRAGPGGQLRLCHVPMGKEQNLRKVRGKRARDAGENRGPGGHGN